ncbi:FtsK/SpoIIIE domain-containing protein [Cellulosimicrobium marinum]|uniref:FtsK/SpoIIIE domain-containing protein n=1 Tax=Cellulosimicrobium marinum TaxID=1638992 RepID=UPI001E377D31|nr:FtsK/SpoIIIE domain-containing protein [Cellulosimicrobium marinum]MCB7136829.1 FHA domain-containing protein [Cellulosimicrobium marinum]
MRIKLTLHRPDASTTNVAVTADATASVRDVAEALFAGDPARAGAAVPERLTLQVATNPAAGSGAGQGRVLSPTSDLVEAGLRSGSTVSIVRVSEQFDAPGQDRGAAVAVLRVLEGPDAGREFPLPVGTSYVGRDRHMDIRLSDPQVSKRHARITVGETIEITDTNSANGLVMGGQRMTRSALTSADTVTIGTSVVSVVALHRSTSLAPTSPVVEFNRSPRVVARFKERKLRAPKPPRPPEGARFPYLAMVAPLIMGVILYSVTKNVLSIVFIGLSPILMLGAYLDSKMQAKRKFTAQVEQFRQSVAAMRVTIERTHAVERAVRLTEAPSVADTVDGVRRLGGLLWTHRPEHDAFLTVRIGLGAAPSRTQVDQQSENDTLPQFWSELEKLHTECATIDGVPVVARLRTDGALGIAGTGPSADAVGRGVLVQLAGLHSPSELVLTALTSQRSRADWEWLEWLPHTGSPHSPLGGDHLADNPGAALSLLSQLEDLVELRGADLGARAELRGPIDPDEPQETPKPVLPTVVVLVEDDAPVDRSRLTRLAERGADAGVHVVWVAPTVEQLPAACRTFVLVSADDGAATTDGAGRPGAVGGSTAGEVRVGRLSYPVTCETVDLPTAHEVARILAPVVDVGAPVDDDSDLPRSVSYLSLAGTSLADDPGRLIDAWRENGSLTPRDGSPPVRRKRPTNLRALVGHSGVEPLYLDLRTQGPHALVGGTTGAGKSEFLQSWVLGMAAAHSPDRVTFLFVDYKGGAAFADCVNLPHTVGLVTDLSPHLVRRALTSLRAELRYREHLLNRKKAKDLASLERTGDPDAPPSLLIVVDEFAALVNEVPEFVDGVVDVAQRGRSLGLHLILATQRPAGVIRDNLRANTNLRVALRMADEDDSTDILGIPMAAHFDPSIPGRGAVKTGPGRITPFQTGYAGGWTTAQPERSRIDVQEMAFGTGARWELPEPEVEEVADPGPNDIARVVSTISAAATQAGVPVPRKPWLAELAPTYDLARLPNPRTDTMLLLGVEDDPGAQAQPTVFYEPDRDGNMAVYGTGGSGKSATLRTIAVSAAITARGGPVQVYAIDCGASGLRMLEDLPHVGAVISGDDEERVQRVLRMLRDLVDERSARYAAVRAGDITEYRRLANAPDEPRVLLLVDGIGAFRESYEFRAAHQFPVWGAFSAVATDGRQVGVHLVVAGDRAASVPTALGSTIQKRLVLRLANEDDYLTLGVPKDVLSLTSPPGRGVLDENEVQVAVLGGDANVALQSRELGRLRDAMVRLGISAAPGVDRLPDSFTLADLPVLAADRPTIGLDDLDIAPVGLPARGTFMLAGPPGGGRTTALVTIAQTVRRARAGRVVYLSPRRTSISGLDAWDTAATSPEDVVTLLGSLTAALESGSLRPGGLTVLVESVTEFTGTPAEQPLAAFVRTAVRAEQLVVGEAESSTWGQAWAIAQPFKAGRSGLLLTPGDLDGDNLLGTGLGRLRRADFPPGRGFLVVSGRARKMHVALPE